MPYLTSSELVSILTATIGLEDSLIDPLDHLSNSGMNRWNDLPYDVLEALCKETATLTSSGFNDRSSPSTNDSRKSLLALSLVDSRTREACYPWLFHKVTFDKTSGSNSPPWEAFDERMKHMVKNPALCRAVRVFELDAWVSDIKNDRPSATTYVLLPIFLVFFPQLRTLTFRIQGPFVPGFRSAFDDVVNIHGPLLTIEKLTISRRCAFLINHCPNLLEFEDRPLSRDEEVKFITLTKPIGTSCQRLRTFSTPELISSDMLQDILTSVPLLEELRLSRPISRGRRGQSEGQTPGQGIMELLPAFARFPHLNKLVLPKASSLGIGFIPPWCGNTYLNNPDLVNQVKREGREAAERVGRGVQEVCPGVSELWVGNICFKRDEKGVMVCSNQERDR